MHLDVVFRCDNCRGPVWIEDIPDSAKILDFVCIICSKRWFIDKSKYIKLAKKILEKKYGKNSRHGQLLSV